MTGHELAPWTMGYNDGSFVDIDSPRHAAFARVVWRMNDDKSVGRPSPECEANAYLVLAAPDLLAAAEMALRDAVADEQDPWFAALKAAVAKARSSTE